MTFLLAMEAWIAHSQGRAAKFRIVVCLRLEDKEPPVARFELDGMRYSQC